MTTKAQLTGMRGVYLVAAELAKIGFIASPTSRSARGADLLVTDQNCQRAYSVQVKTNASVFAYFLVGQHASEQKSESHIYALVNIRKDITEFYIVPSVKLAPLAQVFTSRKGSIWYSVQLTGVREFKDCWKEAFGEPT